ncbi:MAG: hypothetical protein K2N15_11230 [Lachnospiraceae bacterium]|nr:hypothetical protein [Lachnospiraceae bacterium]
MKTDRQLKGELQLLLFIMSLISGVMICHVFRISGSTIFKMTACWCCLLTIVPLSVSIVIWALGNQINKGIYYMWKHDRLVSRLRKQLLDAGIYTTIRFGACRLARIPWIKVDFAPDFKSGAVYIKNSIQFHDKLSRIDISASLGRYVVEQVYLTEDENHYRFDFYDSTLERRLVFRSFEAFRAYSGSLGPYELFVDTYTRLTLTHQLLVGQTGSGKSYALHGYLLQMLLKPMKYHLYFADPKSSSIALLGERISPDTTADDFAGITALLETFVSNMQKRQREMKELLSDKIDGDYRDFGLSPHILIFDEFADFSLALQTKDKKQRDYVSHLISQIVLKGRQAGFYLWIVMQQAGCNNIPTFIRDNLPWKVVLGNAEDQTYVTAFGAGAQIPLQKMAAGEGVYTYPSIANKPRLCSFSTLDFDILDALQAGVM